MAPPHAPGNVPLKEFSSILLCVKKWASGGLTDLRHND
jgi:hypothetical protein